MTQYRSFEALEPVIQMIQEKEPDMKYPIDWAYGGGDPVCLLRYENYVMKDGSYDGLPVNVYETEEYKNAIKVARDFYEQGLCKT